MARHNPNPKIDRMKETGWRPASDETWKATFTPDKKFIVRVHVETYLTDKKEKRFRLLRADARNVKSNKTAVELEFHGKYRTDVPFTAETRTACFNHAMKCVEKALAELLEKVA